MWELLPFAMPVAPLALALAALALHVLRQRRQFETGETIRLVHNIHFYGGR